VAALKAVEIGREGVLGETATDPNPLASAALKTEEHEAFHDAFVTSNTESAFERPHGIFIQPIFREIYNDPSEIVGTVQAIIAWDRYFASLLPDGVKGITCVLKNTCGGSFTYHLDGISISCSPCENEWCLIFSIAAKLTYLIFLQAFYAGEGDLHDERYNHMEVEIPFSDYLRDSTKDVPGHCVYTFAVYPTKEFEDTYHSNLPVLMTSVVAAAFCFMILTFLGYDWFVQRRD
jgi:hypothetical protein